MSFKKVGKAGGNPLAPIFRWTDDKKTAHQEKAIKAKYKGAGDSKFHNKALAEQDKKIHEKYYK
jgi:hypothetical protein